MSKHLNVTIPDYILSRTIEKYPYKNRSQWVSELLLEGIEAWEQKQKKTSGLFYSQDILLDNLAFTTVATRETATSF